MYFVYYTNRGRNMSRLQPSNQKKTTIEVGGSENQEIDTCIIY